MADSGELEMLDNGESGMNDNRGQNGSRHRSRSPLRKSRSRSRSPREWRRGERNRSRDRDRERRRSVREDHRGKVRLYVCNMPYDVNWQFLKDYFKKELGSSVTFVEMYDNPDGKASGAGVVEIKGKENAEKAIEKFDRSEMKGRKIIVREEREKDRIRHQGMGGGGGGGMGARDMPDMRGGGGMNMGMAVGGGMNSGGGMGMGGGGGMGMGSVPNISPQIIQQLNIDPSNVTNQVFVANLDYKVSSRKIRDIFKMAGTVVDVDLKEDKDGKSRGMCVVKFEHPVEAVQAISMFNGQMLYDRTMTVKMDKLGDTSYAPQQIPNKLPSGLQGIGMGLGSGGAPVNVQQIQGGMMGGGGGQGLMGNMGGMGGGMGNMAGTGMGMSSQMGMGNPGMGSMGSGMGNMGTGMSSSMNPMSTMNSSMGMGGQGMGSMGGLSSSMGMSDMGMSSSGMGGMSGLSDMGMGGMNMGSSVGSGMGSGMGGGMDRGYSGSGGMGGGMSRGGVGGGSMNMESTTVFVRNLPFSFSWQDLKQKFNNCGEVKYAEIKMENGRSKGYGTVKFLSPEDARRAVNLMNGVRIDGRQIEVRLNRV